MTVHPFPTATHLGREIVEAPKLDSLKAELRDHADWAVRASAALGLAESHAVDIARKAQRVRSTLIDPAPYIAVIGAFNSGMSTYVMTVPSRSWGPDCWTHVDPGSAELSTSSTVSVQLSVALQLRASAGHHCWSCPSSHGNCQGRWS